MDKCSDIQSTSNSPLPTTSHIIPSHLLVELTSLDELAFPVNSTKRVKYTCVGSTSRCLILGTSTGSVYFFSRYAAKSRLRSQAPVPVHILSTRDGHISRIVSNRSGELIGIGGDSGRVSIARTSQSPTIVYSSPGSARLPDRVTALAWSNDDKVLYSGHTSGVVHIHRLENRSVFRAANQVLIKFEHEIVQIEVADNLVLLATTMAAYVYNSEDGSCQQIGKKTRSTPAPLGCCFVDIPNGSKFIYASRPNGRLWESNLVGNVYATHQFRGITSVPFAKPISFRAKFEQMSDKFEINFYTLKSLMVDGNLFVLTYVGNKICIVDPDSSKIVLFSEFEHDILDMSICGNDIFALFNESKGLRKFSLFSNIKAIEKLNLKSLFVQSSQLILHYWPWDVPSALINKCVEGLHGLSKKKDIDRLHSELCRIMNSVGENNESTYENVKKKKSDLCAKRMPNGVYRVLHTAQESGYEDDFSFRAPAGLRERSRSSPCANEEESNQKGSERVSNIPKRCSVPSNLELKKEWRKNGSPDVIEEDILHRAKMILDSDGQVIEKDSLKTLLQLEGINKDEIRFTPTVTIGNAAKALAEMALAVPVDLSSMWEKVAEERDEGKEKVKPKARATIVKVIRPGVKPVSQMKKEVKEVVKKDEMPIESDLIDIPETVKRERDELWLDVRLENLREKNCKQDEYETNSPIIKNSDTEDTLTTERSSSTPIVDRDIWHNPLTDISTPTMEEVAEEQLPSNTYCRECGMHRSWAAIALLISVCGRGEVLVNEFVNGGTPMNIDEWTKLLVHVAKMRKDNDNLDYSSICPKCETSFSGIEKVIVDGWKNIGLAEDELKVNVAKIRERCFNISKEKLMMIVTKKEVENVKNEGTLNSSLKENSNEKDGTKSSVNIRSRVERSTEMVKPSERIETFMNGNAGFEKKYWRWLNGISMKTILSIALFCQGKKNVLSMLDRNKETIAKCMNNSDWCALVAMSTREASFKPLLSAKTIKNVMESVGVSQWVSPKKPIQTGATARRYALPQTSTWIFDGNSKCPLCSLPVKMVVGGADRGVVVYSCGHAYHKMCISGRLIFGCVACRVRARQATAISKIRTPTSSPKTVRKFGN